MEDVSRLAVPKAEAVFSSYSMMFMPTGGFPYVWSCAFFTVMIFACPTSMLRNGLLRYILYTCPNL